MREKHTYLRPFIGDWPVLEYLKRHLSNRRAHQQKKKASNTEGDAVDDDVSDFPPIRIGRESSNESEDSGNGDGENEAEK